MILKFRIQGKCSKAKDRDQTYSVLILVKSHKAIGKVSDFDFPYYLHHGFKTWSLVIDNFNASSFEDQRIADEMLSVNV